MLNSSKKVTTSEIMNDAGVSLLSDFTDFSEKLSLVSWNLMFVQRKTHVGTSKSLVKIFFGLQIAANIFLG